MSRFQIIVLSLLGVIACVVIAGVGVVAFVILQREEQVVQQPQQQAPAPPTQQPLPTSTPEPTSTPQPTLTPIPENIRQYVLQVRDAANGYIAQMEAIDEMGASPDIQSDAWTNEIITHIEEADSLYEEIGGLTPPPDLETFHSELSLAMGYCQESFDEIRASTENREDQAGAAAKMEHAAELFLTCNDRLSGVDRSKYFEYRNKILPTEEVESQYISEMQQLFSEMIEHSDSLSELFLDPKLTQEWANDILASNALLHSDYERARRYIDDNAVPERYKSAHQTLVNALYDCDGGATLIDDALAGNWLDNFDYAVSKLEEATVLIVSCGEKMDTATAEFISLGMGD